MLPLAILILVTVVTSVFVFLHLRPLNDSEVQALGESRRRKAINSYYTFDRKGHRVDTEFKKNMDADGSFYNIYENLFAFPMLAAGLLKYKKHEWIIVAFEDQQKVAKIWVNKGSDRSQVHFGIGLPSIKQVAAGGSYRSVLVFHNHPNSNPSLYSTKQASSRDKESATELAKQLNSVGVNLIEFVCERGLHYEYWRSICNNFLPIEAFIQQIRKINGTTRSRNLSLHLERLLGWRNSLGGDLFEHRPAEDAHAGSKKRDELVTVNSESARVSALANSNNGDIVPVDEGTAVEARLRPETLDEYVGQERIKIRLRVTITAAKARRESLCHVLLCGPPGIGKRSLAYIIAREMCVNIQLTSASRIQRPSDLATILTNLETGDILFIDEIQRLKPPVEELLYSAMKFYQFDVNIGQGPSTRTIKLDLKPFSLIGATISLGSLTSPQRDRFGEIFRLELYSPEELARIIIRTARVLSVPIDNSGAMEIARRSRGAPRSANRLLRRVRDFAQVHADGVISESIADQALTQLGVDHHGFDNMDRAILLTIIDKFSGGPVGVETLADALGEEPETIECMYEPFLLQQGYLSITPRGRVATSAAFSHFDRVGRSEFSRGNPFNNS